MLQADDAGQDFVQVDLTRILRGSGRDCSGVTPGSHHNRSTAAHEWGAHSGTPITRAIRAWLAGLVPLFYVRIDVSPRRCLRIDYMAAADASPVARAFDRTRGARRMHISRCASTSPSSHWVRRWRWAKPLVKRLSASRAWGNMRRTGPWRSLEIGC